MKTALLIGFPNSGKSTLFNTLTGQVKKMANYSGITVSRAVAELSSNNNHPEKIQVTDLPGIYSLNANTIDEAVTIKQLINSDKENLIVVVLDINRLEASISLCLALKEHVDPKKLIVVVNKDDHDKFAGSNRTKLEKIIGLKVLSISARFDNPREVDRFIRDHISEEKIQIRKPFILTHKSAQRFDLNKSKISEISDEELVSKIHSLRSDARKIIDQLIKPSLDQVSLTQKIDSILMHPVFGSIVFAAIFYLIFLSIYTWAGPAMDLIDESVGILSSGVSSLLPDGLIKSLIVDGAIAGVGAVIIFLPQIMILFFLLNLLEQSGYISRAAVLTDRVFSFFGLNGKAFLPYLSGFACSIPGIMAARTIPDKKERLATMMTLPLITCSARLPVYILIIGTFIPNKTVLGIFNAQALSFFFLYFLGSFFALVIAKIFRLTMFKGKSNNFFIDLPLYQKPSFSLAMKQSLRNGKLFIKKAGTVILVLAVAIWFASTFPRPSEDKIAGLNDKQVSAYTLEHSYLGSLGKTIEPVIKPIGMNWKMGIGLLTAFGARELFVSTMGTIYALGDTDETSESLKERLLNDVDPVTKKPVFNIAVAWSILIFFVFAMQCMSTLAILKKETGGWAMPILATIYMGIVAYSGSFIAYHLLS